MNDEEKLKLFKEAMDEMESMEHDVAPLELPDLKARLLVRIDDLIESLKEVGRGVNMDASPYQLSDVLNRNLYISKRMSEAMRRYILKLTKEAK